MEVFCNDCKYYKDDGRFSPSACRKVIKYENRPEGKLEVYGDSSTLNASNNCPYYESELIKEIMDFFKNFFK